MYYLYKLASTILPIVKTEHYLVLFSVSSFRLVMKL